MGTFRNEKTQLFSQVKGISDGSAKMAQQYRLFETTETSERWQMFRIVKRGQCYFSGGGKPRLDRESPLAISKLGYIPC